MSVVSTVVSLVIGVPAAYALSRWMRCAVSRDHAVDPGEPAWRRRSPSRSRISWPTAELGLLDTLTGLILIYLTFNLSLVIWLMRPFFDELPRALEEAAWIDGAGIWQGLHADRAAARRRPASRRRRSCVSLFAWNDFFFALILTRTEAMTAPVAVVNFMNYEGWEWGRIAAAGVMVMLPVLVFSLFGPALPCRGLDRGGGEGMRCRRPNYNQR